MKTRSHVEHVVEGDYLAAVEVALVEDDDPSSGWGPYMSPADAQKVYEVSSALKAGRVAEAARASRVYRLTPVNAA